MQTDTQVINAQVFKYRLGRIMDGDVQTAYCLIDEHDNIVVDIAYVPNPLGESLWGDIECLLAKAGFNQRVKHYTDIMTREQLVAEIKRLEAK